MPSSWRPLAPFAALLLAAEASLAAAPPPVPLTVDAGKEVVLPAGTVWKARSSADGIVVAGRLVARGTAERPIVLTGPKGWKGILVTGEAVLEHVTIENAETGCKVSGGTVAVADCRITGCAVGVDLDQSGRGELTGTVVSGNGRGIAAGLRARLTVEGCVVAGSRETGVFVSRQAEGRVASSTFTDNAVAVRLWQRTATTVAGCLFRGNRKGVVADQTEAGPVVRGSIFAANGIAAEVVNGSSVVIEGNLFDANDTGVEVDQVSSPSLAGNTFTANGTAVSFLKRSRGTVGRNLFADNKRAVFCDYSSYPTVSGNNFEGKGMAVVLGANQSYDWETREGRHPSPVAGQPTPPPALPTVAAVGNWWGGAVTAEMAAAGADADISTIDDGHDHASVTYEGYAGRNYRMDRVTYQPWLGEPVRDAGAPRDYLKGLRFPGAANPLAGR